MKWQTETKHYLDFVDDILEERGLVGICYVIKIVYWVTENFFVFLSS